MSHNVPVIFSWHMCWDLLSKKADDSGMAGQQLPWAFHWHTATCRVGSGWQRAMIIRCAVHFHSQKGDEKDNKEKCYKMLKSASPPPPCQPPHHPRLYAGSFIGHYYISKCPLSSLWAPLHLQQWLEGLALSSAWVWPTHLFGRR